MTEFDFDKAKAEMLERQAEKLRQAKELAERDKEFHKSESQAPHGIPHTTEEIEEIIDRTLEAPKSCCYFDQDVGEWTCTEDKVTSNTGVNLKTVKTVIASLSTLSTDKADFDGVDELLYKYFELIRHGETTHSRKPYEWSLNEGLAGTVTISYNDGSEWFDDCFVDEVPMWLLLSMLRAIQRKKPLGDQKADETIKKVQDADSDYVKIKQNSSLNGVKLNVKPTFFDGGS
jgi:hypothetical protein